MMTEPTKDDREALIEEWANVHQGPNAQAVLLEMLPIGDQMSLALRDALRELAALKEPRPQGEPSDAQVETAWRTYENIPPDTFVMGPSIGKARKRMRAALRAAGNVR